MIVWIVKIIVATERLFFATLTFTLHFTQVEAFTNVVSLNETQLCTIEQVEECVQSKNARVARKHMSYEQNPNSMPNLSMRSTRNVQSQISHRLERNPLNNSALPFQVLRLIMDKLNFPLPL